MTEQRKENMVELKPLCRRIGVEWPQVQQMMRRMGIYDRVVRYEECGRANRRPSVTPQDAAMILMRLRPAEGRDSSWIDEYHRRASEILAREIDLDTIGQEG